MTSIAVEELRNIISECIRQELGKTNMTGNMAEGQEELLSREQASNILKVSKVTLSKYVKAGKVRAHRIDRKVYFMKGELYAAIRKITFKSREHVGA